MISMPRIFDCFTFFNENDVLDIRLQELSPVVDKFVIIHANQTFRGKPKPDYFDYERFRDYRDQIELLTLDFDRPFVLPDKPTAWDREVAQREAILPALAELGAAGDDTIIVSDVDEIPRLEVVNTVTEKHRFLMDKFTYAINMLTEEGNVAAYMLPFWQLFRLDSVEGHRRDGAGIPIPNAGWEFSSLGTPEHVLHKLKNFSHIEFDTPELTLELVANRIKAGEDILGRDIRQSVVEIDDTWPWAIRNNRQYWSKYEW